MIAYLDATTLSEKEHSIQISGSKSESNRLLILQAFFPNLKIENLSNSDDSIVLQKALKIQSGLVDVKHAGTAMRFLTAYYASLEDSDVILTGSSRMKERPIEVLVNALKDLGADIEYLENPGFPPLKIRGKILQNNKVSISASTSSQYISALMLIAPKLPQGLTINLEGAISSKPYIEMTLSMMRQLGISAEFNANEIHISNCNSIQDSTFTVESDWSSASYFYSMVSLSENLKITLSSFRENSLQGDSELVSIYNSLGVKTEFDASNNTIILSKISQDLPETFMLDLISTPDLAQTIAVSCFGLGIGCKLSGLHTLKIKETDRLVALQNELQKLGAIVSINENSLHLEISSETRQNIEIQTYEDHRMAMAFAPLALKIPIRINNPNVVSKSYPSFWQDLKMIGFSIDFR